jgi:multicomponent Na+:H+ antiporter subunit F
MENILSYIVWLTLVIHLVLLLFCIWRVWRGESIVDRLIALDVISTMVLIVLVVIAIIDKNNIFIDVAIGLAALSAISTIALAKYIADQRMF